MGVFSPKSIYTIAKKEFMDNIRNKWIILLTILFVILIVVFSYLAGGQAGGDDIFGDMQNTVFALLGISSIIIPLIAIVLGCLTISGEAESGSLNVVLSYPISRGEVLLGKLFGLGSVLIFSILLGFGLGGIIISATYGAEAWVGYLAFIGLSIFLGFIYLSLSVCVSSFCKKRITSIAGGIVIFFWSLIYGFIIIAILYGTGYSIDTFLTGNYPDWFFGSVIFSPSDAHQTAVQLAFGEKTISAMGFTITIPEYLTMELIMLVHIVWFIVPLIIAYFLFKRRDI
jgi:Cu-processing system permease protein